MNDLTREQRVLRGQEAARLLKNEVLNEAIGGVKDKMLVAVISGDTPEQREEARAIVLGLGALVRELGIFADDALVDG